MKVLFQRQRDVPDVVCLGTGNLHECEQIYQRIETVVGLPYLKAIVGEKG